MLNEVAEPRPRTGAPRHRRARARTRVPLTYLPNIQALRALAVVLVVLFHLWPLRLTGGYVGVDVFFVISGFLITDHLLRSAEREGGIRLGSFYARRVRRLLPAALLVLLVTALATFAVVPRSLWSQFLTGIAASAVYVGNWLLAARSVDYFAADDAVSPVQHYWSLGVEEQFYLVWPVLLIGLLLLARRLGVPVRRAVLVGLALLGAASLVLSITWTAADQVVAYYATPTHAWEFAAGGLVAVLGLGARRASRPLLASAGMVLGAGLVVGSAVAFDGATAFPGWLALVPVLGAVLVVAGGYPEGTVVARVVELRPVQLAGTISYALYLWHWPVIVLLPYALDRPLTWVDKLVVLAVLVPLSWATTRWVEDPVRRSRSWGLRPGRSLVVGLAASAVLACAVLAPVKVTDAQVARDQQNLAIEVDAALTGQLPCFGAAAVRTTAADPDACSDGDRVRPDFGPVVAAGDRQNVFLDGRGVDDVTYRRTCAPVPGLVVQRCDLGEDTGGGTMVVVGDSHADHLMTPLAALAAQHGMAVVEVHRWSCRPVPAVFDSPIEAEGKQPCPTWKDQVFDYVASLDATVVVTSGAAQGYRDLGPDLREEIVAAYQQGWQQWIDAGHTVLVIGDVPRWDVDVPQCVEEAGDGADPCTVPREDVVAEDLSLTAATGIADPRLGVLDLYPSFCDDTTCRSVVGGLITHRDSNHMTPTFAASLAPQIDESLRALGVA